MITVLGYAVLLKYAGWILFFTWLYFMMKDGAPLLIRLSRQRKLRRLNRSREARRFQAQLDRENREWLEAGIYEGRYPGATMPLTAPVPGWEPEDWKLPPDWSQIVKPR